MIFQFILYLILFTFVLVVGFVITLYVYYKIVDTTTGRHPYQNNIKPSFPFGEFVNIVKDPWGAMDQSLVGVGLRLYWFFTEPTITITEPEIAKSILSAKESNYHRDFSRTPYLLKRLEGTGIIAVDGDEWSRQHRLLSRAFGIKTIRSFCKSMHEICKDVFFSEIDKEIALNNKSINVLPMFQNLAMSLATMIALGGTREISDKVATLLFFLIDHFGDPLYLIPGWINVPTPLNRKLSRAYEELDSLIYRLIQERRKVTEGLSEEERKSLQTVLDILIDSKDQDGSTFTNTEIRDNILTFFLAGSETSATVFTWFLVHTALHPHIKTKIVEEIDSVLAGRDFEPDDVKSLPYFTAALNETMRFTPPLFGGIPRVTKKQEQVGSWTVPAGISLSVNNTAVAHNTKYWKDPHLFNPERFLEPEPKHAFSFIPFGGGSRSCIGKHFALQELYTMLTAFLQRYEYVQQEPNYELGKRPNVLLEIPFLHPKPGTTLFEITKREKSM